MPALIACPWEKANPGGAHDHHGHGDTGHPTPPATPEALSYVVPDGLSLQRFAIVAQAQLSIGEHAQVLAEEGGFAAISSVGADGVRVAHRAETGQLLSVGDVFLGIHASIHGDIETTGSISPSRHGREPWTVDGSVTEHADIQLRTVQRLVSFPAGARAGIDFHGSRGTPDEIPLEPAYYSHLRMAPHTRVVLRSGEYFFDDLQLAPGSTVVLDDSAGPININVKRHLKLDGQLSHEDEAVAELTLVYLGSDRVELSQPFEGALIAPRAPIFLAAPKNPAERHAGQQHAKHARTPWGFWEPHSRMTDGGDKSRRGRFRARFHHPWSHGPNHPHEERPAHVGSFIGRTVTLGNGATVVHHPTQQLIRQIEVDKAEVCAGESVTVDVLARDPAAPDAPVFVTIDGVPLSTYTDQLYGQFGPRMITVAARATDGRVESTLVSVNIVSCPAAPALPHIGAEPSILHPDTVDFVVTNAPLFEDGSQRYLWDFGDGTQLESAFPAVSHDYRPSLDTSTERSAFDVSVTVERDDTPDAAGRRSLVVWNTYALTKSRGAAAPPITARDYALRVEGDSLVAQVSIENREPSDLVFDRRRVDYVACDPDAPNGVGQVEPIELVIASTDQLDEQLAFERSRIPAGTCSLVVHFWGAHDDGLLAQSSVELEMPLLAPGQGYAVEPLLAAMLNHLVAQGLVSDPLLVSDEEIMRLYRERRIRYSRSDEVFYQSIAQEDDPSCIPSEDGSAAPGGCCNPHAPGEPPRVGYSCQPTGEWRSDTSEAYIANAFKGDAVLVRACGDISAMFQQLDPPQRYSHEGIMTRNRIEITQSTGNTKYLEDHPNGVLGQPTDGFEEQALRYLWPGTHTSSVQHAFVGGDQQTLDPDGRHRDVKGFTRGRARCEGDANIIYPRVMKAAPEYEVGTRPKLHAIADAAKLVDSHYRFALYTDATMLGEIDPNAPDWSRASGDRHPGQPTVCSGLLRQSMLNAGVSPDPESMLPRPSDKRGGAPPGLFFYDEDERQAAAHALYAHTRNKVEHKLALLEGEVIGFLDDNWWWVVPAAASVPGGELLLLADVDETVTFATDAPDDIANQLVNCFAADDCGESAKDHQGWRHPGTGIAVSPDNTLDHYDSPEAGGVYGYHEPLVYRGKRHQPTFEWRAALGTRTLRGRVVNGESGAPEEAALVEVMGLGEPATVTDPAGEFSIAAVPGPNIQVHASKYVGMDASGALYEGIACYRPDPSVAAPDGSELLQRVDCQDFTTPLDPEGVLHDTVEVVLGPPPAQYRRVTLTGFAQITDCDCCGFETCPDRGSANLFAECRVGPGDEEVTFVIGQDVMCADEVGVRLEATCRLEGDNAVRVSGSATLFESGEGTCGASVAEHTRDFDVLVREGESREFGLGGTLVHDDICQAGPFPFDCDDRAELHRLTLINETAE